MSPGAALLMADCRSPPAGTTRVDPKVVAAKTSKIEMVVKALVSLGETQRSTAAHSWEIFTFCSVEKIQRD